MHYQYENWVEAFYKNKHGTSYKEGKINHFTGCKKVKVGQFHTMWDELHNAV